MSSSNMKNSTKILLGAAALMLVGGAAYLLLGSHPKGAVSQNAAGATFNDAKVATIEWSLASATSTSILNTDSTDRMISSAVYTCAGIGTSQTAYTGTGLGSLILQSATSSGSLPTTGSKLTNTNFVLQTSIATSSPSNYYNASTTITVAANAVWASGSYLSFTSNATNTAECLVGVNYLAL